MKEYKMEIGYDPLLEQWYLQLDASTIIRFDTAEEAWNMSNKITFVNTLKGLVTDLAKVSDTIPDMVQVYFDRGYNAAGDDPIVDADLEAIGLTAADVASIATLMQNYEKFVEGDDTLVDTVYRVTMNKFRTDT
jgi:hypothetical protein